MSDISIENNLELMCRYSFVELTITFSDEKESLLAVCLGKNKRMIKLTYIHNQTIEKYYSIEDASTAIKKVMKE